MPNEAPAGSLLRSVIVMPIGADKFSDLAPVSNEPSASPSILGENKSYALYFTWIIKQHICLFFFMIGIKISAPGKFFW